MAKPYSYTYNKADITFSFTTSNNISYLVYFNDGSVYFENYAELSSDVWIFGFDAAAKNIPTDVRVKETIIEILGNYFDENKDIILMFVCDQSDNKQMNRKRKFNAWFIASQNISIIKLDKSTFDDSGKSGLHVSVMYHIKNRNADKIPTAFDDMWADFEAK